MDKLTNVARTTTAGVIAEVWSKRAFLGFFAWSKLKASLSESSTAALWWVLEPGLKILIYGTVFGLLLPASSRPDNFVLSLIIGVAIFEMYSAQSTASTRFFPQSDAIKESTSISSWTLMVSTVIETHLKTSGLLLIVFAAALLLGVTPRPSWFAFPLIILGASFFLYAVGLLVASLTRFFPTFPKLLGAFNRIIFYGSGIFWSIERVLANYPRLLSAAELNPVYQLIQMARAALIGNEIDWSQMLLLNLVVTVILFAAGAFLFSRAARVDHG